jgi:predicted nucleotidyltransferase component of viral defense system
MAAIIAERLKKYSPQNSAEEENALKEILQEIILCGLSDAGFFKDAIFQGGTFLRIFHGLERYSEDLDFSLKKSDPYFKWQPFMQVIEDTCKQYGVVPEIIDKR